MSSIVIGKSVAEVWNLLTDAGRWGEWDQGCFRVEGTVSAGALLKAVTLLGSKRSIEIQRFEVEKVLGWRDGGKLGATTCLLTLKQVSGGCEVEFSATRSGISRVPDAMGLLTALQHVVEGREYERKYAFTLEGFPIVHRAMMQDVTRLEALIRLAMGGRGVDMDVVHAWFGFVWRIAESHHKGEDDEVFPRVASRNRVFRGHMAVILAEHEVLDRRVGELESHMKGVTESAELARLLDTVVALKAELYEHLGKEERAFVTAIQESFSEEEQRTLQMTLARSMPRRLIELVVPWMMESASEAELGRVLNQLPWPVRVLYRLSWRPFYESLIEPFAGLPKVTPSGA